MLVKYHCKAQPLCPVNGERDHYELVLTSNQTILVEDILHAVGRFREEGISQEDVTKEVAKLFGCHVKSTGYHSGVFTEVESGMGV